MLSKTKHFFSRFFTTFRMTKNLDFGEVKRPSLIWITFVPFKDYDGNYCSHRKITDSY